MGSSAIQIAQRPGNPPSQINTSPCRAENEERPPRPRRIKVKLADGKERTIQHMMATTFWSPDGVPMSAAEFIERLFGDLPELFRSEGELRDLWSRPDTRRQLLEGLSERGYGADQLAEIARMIEAERSDLFDVLAYIAFNLAPVSREDRVIARRSGIFAHYPDKQQVFLDFVLEQYVKEGVGELDQAKLPQLLELRYHALADAVSELGPVAAIREVFIGFQPSLYARE